MTRAVCESPAGQPGQTQHWHAPRARRARYQTAVSAAVYGPLELLVPLEQARENSGAPRRVPELALVADEAARGDGKHKPDAVLAANGLHLDELRLALAEAVNDDPAVFLPDLSAVDCHC
jgi:hypothetical protein